MPFRRTGPRILPATWPQLVPPVHATICDGDGPTIVAGCCRTAPAVQLVSSTSLTLAPAAHASASTCSVATCFYSSMPSCLRAPMCSGHTTFRAILWHCRRMHACLVHRISNCSLEKCSAASDGICDTLLTIFDIHKQTTISTTFRVVVLNGSQAVPCVWWEIALLAPARSPGQSFTDCLVAAMRGEARQSVTAHPVVLS